MVPVTITKDWGDVLEVRYDMTGAGGGSMFFRFWVKRKDFVRAA